MDLMPSRRSRWPATLRTQSRSDQSRNRGKSGRWQFGYRAAAARVPPAFHLLTETVPPNALAILVAIRRWTRSLAPSFTTVAFQVSPSASTDGSATVIGPAPAPALFHAKNTTWCPSMTHVAAVDAPSVFAGVRRTLVQSGTWRANSTARCPD